MNDDFELVWSNLRGLLDRPDMNVQDKRHLRQQGIFLRALLDCRFLSNMTSLDGWLEDHKLVEQAWNLLLNCSERLQACTEIDKVLTDDVFYYLEEVDKAIYGAYGTGWYFDAESGMKTSVVCSFCGREFGSCPHVPGHVYDGKEANPLVTEIQSVESVNLTDRPKSFGQLRSRLWPWHERDEERGILKGVLILAADLKLL